LFGGIGFEDRLAELGAIVDVVSALVGDETSTTGDRVTLNGAS
jgi:hypothetical protein